MRHKTLQRLCFWRRWLVHALLGEVFALLQLTSAEIAAQDCAVMLVSAVSEVLAGHTYSLSLSATNASTHPTFPRSVSLQSSLSQR